MGTPAFAVASLKKIIEHGYSVAAVVTAPDKPAGRGQKLQQSAVKEFALQHQLPVLQPSNLKDTVFLNELKQLGANLQIVVAFRMLPEVVWNMPELGTYNLHASLLPEYRGAAPINHAIMQGEKVSGVTTFKLSHEIDTGNILMQQPVEIPFNMTAGELHDVLMETGADLLLKSIKQIEASYIEEKPLQLIEQNPNDVSHAPKIFKNDCRINWNSSAENIYNKIRGLSPFPGAFTVFMDEQGKEQHLKIYKATILPIENKIAPGYIHIQGKSSISVETPDGQIQLEELQLQGKRKMTVPELLNGFRFPEKTHFI